MLLPTSGTPIAAPQGFTAFSFDATGTSSPFGPLFGEGFLSDDQTFIVYETTDNGCCRDLIFAGIPATTFPTSGITAYLLESDFVLESEVPFVRGISGGDLTVDGPAHAAIDWGSGIFAGALIAIDGQGFNQKSAASVFGGSVVTGTQATADLVGSMRGSTRVSSGEQAYFFDSDIELARDGDGNAFFGADDPDYFVFQSDGGATEEFAGTTTTYFPNVVTHVDTTETFGARTTRTLNGFSGGALQLINGSGSLIGTSFFGNSTGEPGDVNIFTDATNGTVTATIDVFANSIEQQLVADFGGTGFSAFFDDESFGAIEASATSAEFGGATVTNALLYMVTDELEEDGFLPTGVGFCQCEFLQWGFWGGDLELASGDRVRIHLANWVAGEVSSLAEISAVLGSATYFGHIIGTVNNEGKIYQAVGGYSQAYNFLTSSNPFSGTVDITNFDGADFNNIQVTGGGAGFTGSGPDTTESRGISLNGAFFKGGGDPVAQVGGGFSINVNAYGASGIFAADKQ